ncbi:hypothetical protein CZ771_13145 [Actinomycetales bacterium JB111]|nr:hypothetical protein CZ771_13145 [Actinomycetales bacterium JB111]
MGDGRVRPRSGSVQRGRVMLVLADDSALALMTGIVSTSPRSGSRRPSLAPPLRE